MLLIDGWHCVGVSPMSDSCESFLVTQVIVFSRWILSFQSETSSSFTFFSERKGLTQLSFTVGGDFSQGFLGVLHLFWEIKHGWLRSCYFNSCSPILPCNSADIKLFLPCQVRRKELAGNKGDMMDRPSVSVQREHTIRLSYYRFKCYG